MPLKYKWSHQKNDNRKCLNVETISMKKYCAHHHHYGDIVMQRSNLYSPHLFCPIHLVFEWWLPSQSGPHIDWVHFRWWLMSIGFQVNDNGDIGFQKLSSFTQNNQPKLTLPNWSIQLVFQAPSSKCRICFMHFNYFNSFFVSILSTPPQTQTGTVFFSFSRFNSSLKLTMYPHKFNLYQTRKWHIRPVGRGVFHNLTFFFCSLN